MPPSRTEPLTRALSGSNPVNASEVTLLPQPDSPTMPRTSLGKRSKSRPRTAGTVRPAPAKLTARPRTDSSGSATPGLDFVQRKDRPRHAPPGQAAHIRLARTARVNPDHLRTDRAEELEIGGSLQHRHLVIGWLDAEGAVDVGHVPGGAGAF